VLLGDAGVNEIWGDYGDDHIWGRGGNDVLAGGNGLDIFHFNTGWGADRILDFKIGGAEKLSFDGIAGLTAFAQLTVTSDASGTTVAFGGNSVLLQGVASVTAGDVLFG
jgi:Ca2+-binding RTX toxin-like protein